MLRKTLAILTVTAGLVAGMATMASASQAHPSPDSSCSKPGTHAVYYTPKRHKRDKLTCVKWTYRGHNEDYWKITGH